MMIGMRMLVAAVLGGSAAVSLAAGGGELQRKVETYLAPLVAARDFNGVVLIARGGKPIAQKAYGMADWELGAPIAMRARFRIASITKTFTGAAVVMLAERGKLSYDDPLWKCAPDFPRNRGRPRPTHEEAAAAR
jgi:CubicO group peptidase (beta-lactamase class C family)